MKCVHYARRLNSNNYAGIDFIKHVSVRVTGASDGSYYTARCQLVL